MSPRWWWASALLAALLVGGCGESDGAGGAAAPAPAPSPEDARIALHFHERVPYMAAGDGGEVRGLTADVASFAFRHAGVPFVWRELPAKRQLLVLQQNEGRDCCLGWFKNAERERFARYSRPIYQDQPFVALTRADAPYRSGGTVAALLADRSARLLRKGGYSYGAYLDGLIARSAPTVVETTNENVAMLEMLVARRADYLFIAPEEVEQLIATTEHAREQFKTITFGDMPHGSKRYLLFSRRVPEELIRRIDAGIEAYFEDASHPGRPRNE